MPARTRVRAMHRRTTEGDARQTTAVDSICIFQSNHSPLVSLGMECLDELRPKYMKRLWQDNSTQCSRSSDNVWGRCNDWCPMSDYRWLGWSWHRSRPEPSSRQREELTLWGGHGKGLVNAMPFIRNCVETFTYSVFRRTRGTCQSSSKIAKLFIETSFTTISYHHTSLFESKRRSSAYS